VIVDGKKFFKVYMVLFNGGTGDLRPFLLAMSP
jgi:hypothetical protein